MAPTRRKGATATAALRQWKVGDLVLAKVKGFPAWPAKVSEPDKWGFPLDWKKVFVYFFGTQQIAFCNPADVEAFTEEKKENLLVKRHGKGSDFVRAVHEIIDSFEKLKNDDQSTNVPLMDEVTMTDGSNSVESLADSDVKDEAPKAINGTFHESTDSTKIRCYDDFPVEEAAAATKQDPSRDGEAAPSEDPTININAKEISLPTMYSMKKNRVAHAQNFLIEKGVLSARRSRSSSRLDTRKFRNFILPSSNIRKSVGSVDRYGLRDALSRRSKRIRKSSDVSEFDDVDSPAFASSGSPEENDSETGTCDSDTLSFNEGSTVESGYGQVQTESVVECSEGDTELKQKLEFQSSAVIVKKKRKPSRKRANSGTNELIGRLEKEPESEIEEYKASQILPSDNKDLNAKYINEYGDEHLPLLKRARVRMGRQLSEVGDPDSSVQPEEKSSEVSDCWMVRLNAPSNSDEDSPVDKKQSDSLMELDNSSMTNKFPVNKPPVWEVKKHFGCSVDDESALPPSKRIQRALEAMSANVAEDVQATSEAPSSLQTSVNASCFSAFRDFSNTSPGNKSEGETILHNVDLSGKNASQDAILGCSTNSAPSVVDKGPAPYVEVAACNIPLRSNYNPKPTSCGDRLAVEAVDCSDCKDPGVSSLSKNLPEPIGMSQRPLTVVSDRELISHEGKQEDLLRPSIDNHQIENIELKKPFEEDDHTGLSTKNSFPVLANVEIINCSTHNDTDPLTCNLQNNCDTTNLSKLDTDKDYKDNGMFMVKENSTVKDIEVIPSSTTEATPTSLQDLSHLLRSSSHSEDHLSCESVSGIRSSSSPTGGLDSARVPPHNTSGCNMSASDNTLLHANNGCCSLDVPSSHEKLKHAGKQNGKTEANAVLTSFEVILGLLTRTKDSIGRATRIAIECGKLGIAYKVVELLARYLDREPSLPKRVDLFFLVDSIMQCSRGLKGEIGDAYPSAIQAHLPRLLLAAAPPGSNGQENRRQCLKVLRLWHERRILSESVIRRHIRDLDSASNPASADPHCRRVQRNERAFDDPLREVEGMVDEYGSNSSFQLPGFRMPSMPKDEDEGCDSDGESFEAVTPEHNSENPEGGKILIAVNGRHSHMLEAVDGELEMEDVGLCKAQLSSNGNGRVCTAEVSNDRFEQKFPVIFPPPPPKNVPPSSPSLPISPLPPPPPPLPLPPQRPPPLSALPNPVTNVLDSKLYTNDDKKQFTALRPVAPREDPITLDECSYHAPENGDLQISMQIPESANTDSFDSLPVPHPPIQPLNSVPQVDGAISHSKAFHLRPQIPESANSCPFGSVPVSCPPIQPVNSVPQVNGVIPQKKAFHLRPPRPAPSNQFSYVQADHRTQTREIPPQPYPDRFHFQQNTDRGNFYSDHARFGAAQHDVGDNWSLKEPSFSGPNYHDRGRLSYAHGPYGGPPREPPRPNHSWAFPPSPRVMHHRDVMPHRPPLDGPIPVASRGPSYWRPI